MAKIKLRAYRAAEEHGGFQVKFEFNAEPPFPTEFSHVRNTDEALLVLDDYMSRVAQFSGQLCAVSMDVVEGRKPNGFKKRVKDFYRVDPVLA